MHYVPAKQIRSDFTHIGEDVAFRGERYVVTRNGRDFLAIVSMEDLQMIRAIEDKLDNLAADKAEENIARNGTISLEELERKLGIDSAENL